ncbi:MAG: aspartate--tRNA ligase [Candidatus Abyssobacteria bacterium SURF_17]|uniref:Aspartate--tRNA(Asp/Asn) ligase n=1 Tax=Candidatus Abyssobacteria bacterium SURF_17 TaxID=2093361 RepID=A0A419EUE6_9BACT|nr:MAG: aspartate--tRNA ligase [Candidatus Abyssubacteria bacterium SURF_17]
MTVPYKRTHYCGELRIEHSNRTVTLAGWVHRRRDHGNLIFIDLRDRTGLVQVVFNPQVDSAAHELAQRLRTEFVIAVTGAVSARPKEAINEKLVTGEIEVFAHKLDLLSQAETPPFVLEDEVDASEDVRLKYRYLDLRRPSLQRNFVIRHKAMMAVRNYFDRLGFLEIETPFLTKSTPEGARDFLVPSRLSRGEFYALPQSPQLFKQILMVGGMDKYFQIVKCFRDEDLRADRQLEFTQIDVEMSFITREDIIAVTEGMMKEIYRAALGIEIQTPLPRLPYAEAMSRFGKDAPDLRFGIELKDVSDLAAKSEFKVFKSAVESGGCVKAISVPGIKEFTRKRQDELAEYVKVFGAKGLAWLHHTGEGLTSPIAKFFDQGTLNAIAERVGSQVGDYVMFVADKPKIVYDALGNLRVRLARELGLIPADKLAFTWVLDFPLLHYNEEEKRLESEHHPFTSPLPEDLPLLDTDPLKVRAQAYDLVLNGTEIGGGSIRIHDSQLQQKIFMLLNIGEVEAREKFGFLLDALSYGAPPHGGIAMGFDRVVMLLCGASSIREVIAFPKTQKGVCAMTGAPAPVDARQLKELGIKTDLG